LCFFALRMTTGLKIPGVVIPRRVFTQPRPKADLVRRRGARLGELNAGLPERHPVTEVILGVRFTHELVRQLLPVRSIIIGKYFGVK
jgi:hypothetical protein